MANHMHSSRKGKDEGNNKGSYVIEKGPTSSGFAEFDTTSLRRSARETLLKKMVPTNSSTRKSERLEKMSAPTAAVKRKPERVEKEIPSPLRRSERTKNHTSTSNELSGSSDSKQKKQKKEKSVKQLTTFEVKEVSVNEKHVDRTAQVKNHRRDARNYRASFYKKAILENVNHPLLPYADAKVQEMRANSSLIGHVKEPLKNNGVQLCNTRRRCNSGEAHEPEGGDCVEWSKGGNFKRKRVDHDPIVQEGFSCSTKSNQESVNRSATEDRVEIEASMTAGIAERGLDNMQQKESSANFPTNIDENICLICQHGGRLLCCHGKGCNGCYHPSCLEPPMVDIPLGVWHCHVCVRKKIEWGVYSVSEGVESIWDAKEVEVPSADGLRIQKQFFVKYKGLAHAHNRWLPENQLLLEAPLTIVKFNKKDQALRWNPDWSLPHRLLLKRRIIYPKGHDGHSPDHDNANVDCQYEWLVKWRGLGYEHSTWELDKSSFMGSTEGESLIRDYENRRNRAKKISLLPKVDKKLCKGSSFSKLRQVPGGVSSAFGNNNLDTVNKLREHWQKGQNSIVIDDQDRILKVVAFILSLQTDACQPFLIISTSADVRSWEDQFSHLAPCINIVVYSGNRDVRSIIRTLEFYKEGGCILFEVLIVVPEVLIEDLDVLRGIRWEAIIVDESQYSKISYLKEIKMLDTDMRLLLFNGQLKDGVVEYLNIMDLLDHESSNEKDDELISNSNVSLLKERLSSYIAYRRKSDSVRFVEYWLPVQISNVQLEQYCATLLSNSSVLGSSSRSDTVEALRDILTSIRKCCNHPYTVDPYLQTLLTEGLKEAEYLDVGVRASGKLQLLDSMLTELKKQGLRGLVLFQSIGGSGRMGDILDDFLRLRFGPDSYERIDKVVPHSRKVAALNLFNNKDSGRFVFLLETCACSSSIKLSSVDTVIIFDSDWNPMNDIRSLQKISLNSQLDSIKVFRLYSSFTVEEKALIFAKQDKALDGNIQNISRSTCHMLLIWGAYCLFDDLRDFHDDETSVSSLNPSSGLSLMKEAVQEFSSILQRDYEDNYRSNSSIILKIQQSGGSYHTNFSLFGERKVRQLDEGLPLIFWTKLLEGKHPHWKYSRGSPQRGRKRVQLFGTSVNRPEVESGDILKKRRRVTNNVVDQSSSKCEGEGKISIVNKEGNCGDSVERPAPNNDESDEVKKLRDEQRSLHLLLKRETAKLCEILHLPDHVKIMVEKFLEYVMNNHHVHREPLSVLQAFQMSMCWTAASLLKHKIDHKASLVLAKQHLNFDCKKEEADYIFSMLQCLKKMFLYRTRNPDVAGLPKASELSKKLHSCTGLAPEVELAEEDISKSIKEIQKKCRKQLRKLLLKQQEEKDKLNAIIKEQKAEEEHKYKIESAAIRSLTPNDVIRKKKLEDLDAKYARIVEDLKCQHEIHLKDLQTVQLAARQMVQDREATWVEQVKSWAEVELLSTLPSKKLGTRVEYLRTSEQFQAHNSQKNVSLVSNEVPDGQTSDKMVHTMPRNGIGLSETPEMIYPVSIPYSNLVEVQTPLDNNVSAKEMDTMVPEGGSVPRNEDQNNSQGDIVSLCSHSKEHNSDGGTIMADETQAHENFTSDDCREDKVALDLSSSDEEICDGTLSDILGTKVAVDVHKTGSLNDGLDDVPTDIGNLDGITSCNTDCEVSLGEVEAVRSHDSMENIASFDVCKTGCSTDGPDEVPLSDQGNLDGTTLCDPGSDISLGEVGALGSHDDVENIASLNSLSSEEHIPSGSTICMSKFENAAQILDPNDNNDLNDAVTLDPPLSEERIDGSTVPGMPGTEIFSRRPDNFVPDNPLSSFEQISDGGVIDVLDRELSSRLHRTVCASEGPDTVDLLNPLSSVQQISDVASISIPHERVPGEVPETSHEVVECHNDREHQTDLDKTTTLFQQERLSRTVNENMSQADPALSSSLLQSLVIPSQAPAISVNEALQDACTSSPASSGAIDKAAIAVEMQNSSPQLEPILSTAVVPANQLNHESLIVEPPEQGQQLPSAENPSSNYPSNLTSATGIEHEPINEDNHCGCVSEESIEAPNQAVLQPTSNQESLVLEHPEQRQLLPSAEYPPCNQDTSVIEHQPINKENHSCRFPRELIESSDQSVVQPASNHESLVIDPSEQGQLLPSAECPPSNQDPPNLPSYSRIEHQPICEDNNISRHATLSSTEAPNQAVVHPASNSELDSYTPVGRFRTQSSDTGNMSIPSEYNNRATQNTSQSASRTAPPLYCDPLQNELERIRKEIEQTVKFHEDMKLQLKSDYEKEMEELRRKYENKFHEFEVEFQQRKKSLDTNLNKVVMNKILAEAFRSKCMDLKVSNASGMQQDASFAEQLAQLSRQQTGIRPSLVTSPSSCGPPAASLQSTSIATCSQTMMPPSQAAYDTSGVFSNVSTRPPHINSISPSSGDLQVGSEIRAPAPHLRPYRASTLMPASGLPTFPNGMPIHQAPSNIAAAPSPSFPQLRPRPTPPTHQSPSNVPASPSPSFSQLRPPPTPSIYQSDPHNRGHRPDRAGELPTTNLSSMELRMDANSQSGTNLRNVLPRLSDGVSLNRSQFGTGDSGMQVTNVHQATPLDIVCLSDDD